MTFNAAIGTSETDTVYKEGLKAVHDTVFPMQAILTQKRYMQCFLRKPAGTKTAEFIACLCKINAYLPKFPAIGTTEQVSLPDDELLDILEYGIPNMWQLTMILHNFDPLEHLVAEFVLFCEQMEQVKNQEGTLPGPKSILKHLPDRSDVKANASRKKQCTEQSSGKKHCMLHGEGIHSSEECHTLQWQAKKMKATYEAQTPDNRWQLKKKQELNAIIVEKVSEALAAEEKKCLSKKRKVLDELNQFKQLSILEMSQTDVSSDDEHSDNE